VGVADAATLKSIQQLSVNAQACLANKVDTTYAPLWHMGKVAKYNSSSSLSTLQEALDFLTCKARAKMAFSEREVEFLREIYEAFWWGGHYKGYPEAAALANHYVNGNGVKLNINSAVYEQSKIVQATMMAMKTFIKELRDQGKPFTKIKCSNPEFMTKPYAKSLKRMNYLTEGKMKYSGVLEAAQNDHRLHKADGHFYLEAKTATLCSGTMKTTWSVESIYDFEPFDKKNYYSNIPLGKSELIVYDGLSEYMTRIGAAKAFVYRAEWTEVWGK
jgi:hypothetical protein